MNAEEAVVGETVLVKDGERVKVLAIVGGEGVSSFLSKVTDVPANSKNPHNYEDHKGFSKPKIEYLRELYGNLDIRDANGFRRPYDEELVAMYEEGQKKRWIEVEFETPCDDGSPRAGLFSTFRRIQ